MTTNVGVVIAVLVVFYVLNGIAIKIGHKPQTSMEEYGVGSRSLGWILVCFSYMGGWYVGSIYTGWFSYSADLGLFAQYLIIYSTAGLIVMYLMAKPVWTWGKEYQLETQADLIELRYGNKKFKIFYTIFISIVNGTWLVVEFVTLGYIVSAATNQVISFNLGIIIIGGAVVLYSLIGGVRASSIGALFQGLVFTVIGTITFFYLIFKTYGGIIPLMQLVEVNMPDLLILDPAKKLDFLWTGSIITGTLGAFCWPAIFNRIYMTTSPRETKKAVYIAPLAALFIAVGILWLAAGARTIPGFPADAQGGAFWMANQYGGPVALGLVAVFASFASISTISGAANGISVLLAKDVVGNLAKNNEIVLKSAKIITLVLGVVTIFIATMGIPQLVAVALGMYDCIVQVIVPLFLGLYWKRGNLHGAIAGLLIGIIVTIGALLNPSLVAWAGGLSGGIIGLAANIIVYVICGFVFGKQDHVDELFDVLKSYDDDGVKWVEETSSPGL